MNFEDRKLAVSKFLEELLWVIKHRESFLGGIPVSTTALHIYLGTLIYQKHTVHRISPDNFTDVKGILDIAIARIRSPRFSEEVDDNKVLIDFINTHSSRDLVVLTTFEDCYRIILDRLIEANDFFTADHIIKGKDLKSLLTSYEIKEITSIVQVLLGVSPSLIEEGVDLRLIIEHVKNFKEEIEICFNTGSFPAVHGIYTPVYRQFRTMGGHSFIF